MLKPDEASPIVGVPVAQLLRWAWLRVGPKNSGTRIKPLYDEDDLQKWKDGSVSRSTGTAH